MLIFVHRKVSSSKLCAVLTFRKISSRDLSGPRPKAIKKKERERRVRSFYERKGSEIVILLGSGIIGITNRASDQGRA